MVVPLKPSSEHYRNQQHYRNPRIARIGEYCRMQRGKEWGMRAAIGKHCAPTGGGSQCSRQAESVGGGGGVVLSAAAAHGGR